LRIGKTNLIGFILPDYANTYYAHLLRGVDTIARAYNYTVVVNSTNEEPRSEQKALRSLISASVDGVLAVPVCAQPYNTLSVPYVFVSRYDYYGKTEDEDANANMPAYVVNDDYMGQYMATEHLITRGFRRIFLLIDKADMETLRGTKVNVRIRAFRQALIDYGIDFKENMVVENVYTLADAYATTNVLLSMMEPPIAFSANNDNIALGVLHAACERRMEVPRHVAVIGYDDLDFSSYLTPPLTTIHLAKVSMGSNAAKMLVDMIEGTKNASQLLLCPRLVQRATT